MILIATPQGLVCATPGAADTVPAASYDRTGGRECAGMTTTVWVRRGPPTNPPPSVCRCAVCKKVKTAPTHGCACCTAAIHNPRKHLTMGLPMCARCSKAAGGTPTAPECPACQQSAGGCSVPCYVCGRAYHASSCSGGFTAYSSGSSERVCTEVLCRVAHMPGQTKCCSCQRLLSGSHDPVQCTRCMRVWCQRVARCSISLQTPVRCGRCRQDARSRPKPTPLRDGGPMKRPRGGNP
jgi:hypothetical protein